MTQHWADCWKPTGLCDSDQPEAMSPTLQKSWVVGGLHRKDLRGIQQSSVEKNQLSICCPQGPEAVCYPHKSGGIWEFSPATSPVFAHCFGRDKGSGEGGVKNLDTKHTLLVLCRMKTEAGPSWGKII